MIPRRFSCLQFCVTLLFFANQQFVHIFTAPAKPSEAVLFEAGGVATLLKFAYKLGLIDLINKIVPGNERGPSIGHYIVLAAINRALDPVSKLQIGDWYQDTVLQRLWGFPSSAFTSQSYWNHMDLIVNLALLTTKDFQIPLFHTYKGNIPDVAFFPEVAQELLRRRSAIFGHSKEATLVFDKGNLSDETLEKMLYDNIHFVAGVKAERIPDIFSVPIDKFREIAAIPGSAFYETVVEICGKSCRAVVSCSESFFTQQLASLTASMTKCEAKLRELQKSLLASALGKKKGKRSTKREVHAKVQDILSAQHMKELFTVVQDFDGLPYINYSVNRKSLDTLTKTVLGRTLLLTNRLDLLAPEVIRTYRNLEHIEEAFKFGSALIPQGDPRNPCPTEARQ